MLPSELERDLEHWVASRDVDGFPLPLNPSRHAARRHVVFEFRIGWVERSETHQSKCAQTAVLSVPRDHALRSPTNRKATTMEFGIFHEFPSLPGRSHAEAFAQSFELVDAAERWGLDAMWLGELHFDPARSVLSAPLCIASAIAARTQRMKIGLAVQVLPLCHPLRLAEEAATVDQISNGRLIFGVGRSGVARTYEAYGVPYGESRERFAEILDIVQKAWTQETVSYQGKFHRFENVAVVPKPYQQPTPPIRVAATSADTFVSIGRQGCRSSSPCAMRPLPRSRRSIRTIVRRWRPRAIRTRRRIPARSGLYGADRRTGARRGGAEPDPLLPAAGGAAGGFGEACRCRRRRSPRRRPRGAWRR